MDDREFGERLEESSSTEREHVANTIEEHFQQEANRRFLETGKARTPAEASMMFSETPDGLALIEWRNRAAGWAAASSSAFDEPEEERDADEGAPWRQIQLIADEILSQGEAKTAGEALELALQRNPGLAEEHVRIMRQ